MKSAFRLLLSIVVVPFFVGCAATFQLPEPTEMENVLLAGQFEITFPKDPSSFGGLGGRLPEGSFKEHIQLTFSNSEMDESYETTTLDESGLFLLRVPANCEIHLVHLAIQMPGQNWPGYTFSMLDPTSPHGAPMPIRTFEVGAQQVYDLGQISYTGGAPPHLNFRQTHQEGQIQTIFREKFPESEWNQYTWGHKDMGEFPAFQFPQGVEPRILD